MTLQSLADEIAQLLGRCAWNNTGYLVFMDGHTFRINRLLQGFNQKNAAVSDVEILASEIGQLQSQIMWEQNSLISFMNRHYSILNNDIHIMQQKQGDWYNATMELQREIDAKDASIAELSRRTRVPDESVEMKSSESLGDSNPLISNDELEELKKIVAELESELQAKDEEMKEIVEESLSLKGQIERLGIKDNEQVKSMDLLRNQMETQAKTLQGRLAGAESRCKELELEVKSLQQVIKADEKELKELKSVETVWAHPSVPAEIHLLKELKTDLVDTVLTMVDSAFVTLSEVKKIKHSLSLKGIQMAERVDSCLRATTSQHKALMNSVETNERLCNETYADNLQLRDEVTRLEAKVKELGADIKKKTLSLQALEEKHKSLKEDYDMSQLACKEAKVEQKRLETMIAASDENTANLQKQVKDLQKDERKRSDLDVYGKQQENVKKIYEPKDEKEREEGMNLVLTHELQVAIHVENIRLKKQLKDLQACLLKDLQAKKTTLSDEQLENELVELRCEKDALRTEISDLQFTVLTLETENASLQQRMATQKARLDSYEDNVDLYILGENRELQGKVKKSEIDMQNEREEREELRKKLAHYEEDLKKARFDMENLKRRNEKTVRIAADIEDYQCNKLNFTRLKDSYINMCIVYDSILDHYNLVYNSNIQKLIVSCI